MPLIAGMDNLRLAFLKAKRGKSIKTDVIDFGHALEANLRLMREGLLSQMIPIGDYHFFTVYDPKERRICAAPFAERVMHHAIMNICEPMLERAAIYDSYACRKGKGRLAAIGRALEFLRKNRYYLKMDIRKYFDSIDQTVLSELLERRFKDRAVLTLFRLIIESYETSPDKGLPIGNLTSQHFANYYLGILDRFMKEDIRCRYYVRYMDDFVVWADDKIKLRKVLDQTETFLKERLKLNLKEMPCLNRTAHGMDFLGFRIFSCGARLNHRSKIRFIRKVRSAEEDYRLGLISELELQRRVTSLLAFVTKAQTLGLRKSIFSERGSAGQGARTASIAAAAGTTMPVTAGQRTGTGTTRATGTTTWASGSSCPPAPPGRVELPGLADPAAVLPAAGRRGGGKNGRAHPV